MKKDRILTWLAAITGFCLLSSSLAEEGVTEREIIIGTQLDLSGPIVSLSVPIKNGMNMKVREINEAGGIHGRKLKLIIEDHGYDPKKAVMVTNKMITLDKILCFVGNLGTATTMATIPLMEQKGVPMLFPNAFKESLYNPPRGNVFCLYPSYIEQAKAIATFFVKRENCKKIGLLYQDDELGEELFRGLEERLGTYGLKIAGAESYKRGATDFSSQIAKLKKAELDVIVIGAPPRESVAALKEMRKLSWDVTTSLCGASGGSFYVHALAQESGFSVDGTYTILNRCDYTMPDAPASLKEWVKRYQEWFGMTPEVTVTAGYEPIHFFAVAAERAGKDLSRKTLIEALEGFKEVPSPLCGPPMTFTPQSRLGSKAYFIAQYQGGKFLQVSEYLH